MKTDTRNRKLNRYYKELARLSKEREKNPTDDNWNKYYRKLKQIKHLIRYGE